MAQVTLTSSEITPNTVKLHSGKINYAWKNLTSQKPIQRAYGATEVQFMGWENPVYRVNFFIPADAAASSDYITWAQLNTLARQRVTDGNPLTLSISTGELDSTDGFTETAEFSSYALDSTTTGVTDIPVIIKDFTVNFDPGDSINGYFWSINMTLQETK